MQEPQETQVLSLGREDPLEEGMAAHSSILAWKKLHGQRNLVGYGPWGPSLQGVGGRKGLSAVR